MTLWATAALWVFCVIVALSQIVGSAVDLANGDLTSSGAVWTVVMVLVVAVAVWAAPKLVREFRAPRQ